jgi:hypothetical protein
MDYAPGHVERRLREAAALIRARKSSHEPSEPQPATIPGERYYDLAVLAHSYGTAHLVNPRGRLIVGRSVENYLSDGERDASRSHYSLNGRKVRRSAYRRAIFPS